MFRSAIFPKFSQIPNIVGAVRSESEMVKDVTEFWALALMYPIANAISERVPAQLDTFTVSILN